MDDPSGVVVQHPDGSLEAVRPKAAKRHLAAMSPEQRECYEDVSCEAQRPAGRGAAA